MANKPGFQGKIGGETLVYIIIGILIFGFIFFMPNIYKLISNLKIENYFEKNSHLHQESNLHEDESEDKIGVKDELDASLICEKMESTPDGNYEDVYMFYYDNRLKHIQNNKVYDAIADEYLNYVYSEQARFNNMSELYKSVPGFSYESKFESRMLKVTFLYNMLTLNQEELYNDDYNLSIELNVNNIHSLEEIKLIYENLGYECR